MLTSVDLVKDIKSRVIVGDIYDLKISEDYIDFTLYDVDGTKNNIMLSSTFVTKRLSRREVVTLSKIETLLEIVLVKSDNTTDIMYVATSKENARIRLSVLRRYLIGIFEFSFYKNVKITRYNLIAPKFLIDSGEQERTVVSYHNPKEDDKFNRERITIPRGNLIWDDTANGDDRALYELDIRLYTWEDKVEFTKKYLISDSNMKDRLDLVIRSIKQKLGGTYDSKMSR